MKEPDPDIKQFVEEMLEPYRKYKNSCPPIMREMIEAYEEALAADRDEDE